MMLRKQAAIMLCLMLILVTATVDVPPALAAKAKPVVRALLIGNSAYGGSLTLKAPGRNVDLLRAVISQSKFDGVRPSSVTVKKNISAAAMRAAITKAFAPARKNDVSIFFFSGHGVSGGGGCYLLGIGGSLSMTRLRAMLNDVPGRVVVMLDCCYSGGFITKSGALSSGDLVGAFTGAGAKGMGKGAADKFLVAASCRADQLSYEVTLTDKRTKAKRSYGVFSMGVAKGCGKLDSSKTRYADANQDKRVTLRELKDYTTRFIKQTLSSAKGNRKGYVPHDVQIFPAGSRAVLFDFR